MSFAGCKNRQSSLECDDEYSQKHTLVEQENRFVGICKWNALSSSVQRHRQRTSPRHYCQKDWEHQHDLYMTGTLRSWIHYIQVRAGEETQKEHRVIAQGALDVLRQVAPIHSSSIFWR